MHPSVFPDPETFRPKRWVEAGTRLDKYLVSFGKGTRQCVGINLAYAELYLTVAAVVHRLDREMYETGLSDIVCNHDFFVGVADLNSKGVRAKLMARM
jgi:cytochrome P450